MTITNLSSLKAQKNCIRIIILIFLQITYMVPTAISISSFDIANYKRPVCRFCHYYVFQWCFLLCFPQFSLICLCYYYIWSNIKK